MVARPTLKFISFKCNYNSTPIHSNLFCFVKFVLEIINAENKIPQDETFRTIIKIKKY